MSEETFAEQMARIDALFVNVAERARLAQQSMAPFVDMVDTMAKRLSDPVCDYSYLRESQCAHCLGHKLEPELEEVVEA